VTEFPRNSNGTTALQRRRGRPPQAGVVLDRLPKPVRKSRYPWRIWEDGAARVIWYPEHFTSTQEGMRSTLVTHARKRDIAVACVLNPEHEAAPAEHSVAFQFFPDRTYRDGPPPGLFD
jgi:hypothetical protein